MRHIRCASVRLAKLIQLAHEALISITLSGCAKGKRDCTYPEPRETPKTSGRAKRDQPAKLADASQSSSDSDDSTEQSIPSARRRKKSEADIIGSSLKGPQLETTSSKGRALSPSEQPQPSIEQVKVEGSLSPSTDASSAPTSSGYDKREKLSSVSTEGSQEDKAWSHLSPDLQYYLDYHTTQLTFHHYQFKHDANYFLHHILIEQALSYEPLLFAVAGFAAYNSTVKQSNGKMQTFLGYYNKSVSLLLKSLQENEKHTDATMLTILQLATFEDYLGDLVSLLGHQKAAYGMLVELYSPQSMMETEIRRKILTWYLRFDVMGGLMAGYSTVLGREWFLAQQDYYRQQSLSYPMSIDYKIEVTIADHRVLAGDLALLYAQLPRGEISVEDFSRECEKYSRQLETWRDNLDPVFRDESFLVEPFGQDLRRDPQDIVDPYKPGSLYKGALYSLNFLLMDWQSMHLMHKHKTAVLLRQKPPSEVQQLALDICRQFEAIEYWSGSPQGAVLKAQGSLGLAIVFLPRDEKHIMWCRRKLAKIECLGHIYPATLRHKMADEWKIPELSRWWLPDESACPPVVRSVKAFMEDRMGDRMGDRQMQGGGPSRSEDQRNINGIFSKLSIGEESTRTEDNDHNSGLSAPADFSQSRTKTSDDAWQLGSDDGFDVDMAADDYLLQQNQFDFYSHAGT
ncbi:hypothetical protein ACLMJK_005066 [Lecanora helva]